MLQALFIAEAYVCRGLYRRRRQYVGSDKSPIAVTHPAISGKICTFAEMSHVS